MRLTALCLLTVLVLLPSILHVDGRRGGGRGRGRLSPADIIRALHRHARFHQRFNRPFKVKS